MGLAKMVGLVIVSAAAGSMLSSFVAPKIVSHLPASAAGQSGAISFGVTAGSTALVFAVLHSVL